MHFEYIGEGLKMTALGIVIVFLVLIIIWLVLEGMKKVFEKKPKTGKTGPVVIPATAPPGKAAPVKVTQTSEEPAPAPEVHAGDDSELIAVIAAAVASSLNTNPYNIRIKSYKRIANVSR